MEHPSLDSSSLARSDYLVQATRALLFIHDTRASGRLSLRGGDHFMIVHLYFKEARLVHVTGNKHDAESLLNDLLTWTSGTMRFDAGFLVPYETLMWQQAQIFARWLAFLEMRGLMQGMAQAGLRGLTHSLTAHLPGEPIDLPEEVARYEEYTETARGRQWQRFSEGVQQLVERALSEEQRDQLKQAAQRVNQAIQQAGEATQDVAKRVSRATQDGLAQVVATAQEVTRQGTRRAEELVKQSLSRERRHESQEGRQVSQPGKGTGEPVNRRVVPSQHVVADPITPLPPELQALSIRYRRTLGLQDQALPVWEEQ